MSLKAKIEAVIYASEEPVTLAQLVGLLGHEGQAEMDHRESAQQTLTLDEGLANADTLDVEAEHAATLDHALHVAAVQEAVAARAAHHHAEADAAAMSSAEDTVPFHETATGLAQAESTGEQQAGPAQEAQEDKRSVREKERRLREYFRSILDQLIADYAGGDRGLEIREVAGGYRLATKPEYHDAVRGFVKSLKPPLKLSLQALETLAVVAYKQPVTAPEISEIRGVDSGGVLGSLMARKLITTAGRKQVIGRPILYKTTRDFLVRFGLKDIGELPSIEEFEKMAGELAEQEEIPMGHTEPPTAEGAEQEQVADAAVVNESAEGEATVEGQVVAEASDEDAAEIAEQVPGQAEN